MVDKPKATPSRHNTFGISDSLLDAVKKVHGPTANEDNAASEAYVRPKKAQRDRAIARKSDSLKSKDSVGSSNTTRFKQRHAGDTVAKRPGTKGMARGTGVSKGPNDTKRPVGGNSAVHQDLTNVPEDEFRRKYRKSKSAMRTGLRKEELESKMAFKNSDYQYNRNSWMDSLRNVGKDGLQEGITVEMTPGGTSYKVLSVSADLGSRIKVGETLSDTNIDDLRDSDVSISYKGGKGGKGGDKKMEAKEALSKFGPAMDKKLADDEKATFKKQGTIKMRKSDGDGIHGTTVQQTDTAKIAALKAKGYKTVSEDKDVMKHNCATHVESTEFGEGVCITAQHAEPDDNGNVEWYDVMFEHGIERVVTETVAVVKSANHMHSSKMKKKKAIMGSKMEEKDVMKHNCATHVKHEEFGEGNPLPGQHTLVEKEKKECETCDGTGQVKGEECDHCDGKGYHMEGYVSHYDVMFAEGIQKNVPVENLEILGESMHSHKTKKGKMIASKNKMEKLDPVGQGDADIDNDGDEDSSDKYLHKRRKAIKKAISKEGFNENFSAPGAENPKDAAQAYGLAEHYLQLANRDELFGREDKKKVHEDFAKKFFDKYKEMVANGDESGEDTFKNEETTKKLESFSESENSQTNESSDQNPNIPYPGDEYKRKMTSKPYPGNNQKASNPRQYAIDKAKKDRERLDKGKTFFQNKKALADKGIKSKPIDKDKFFGKGKTKTGGVQNEDLKEVEFEGSIIYEGFDSSNLPEHAPEVVEHTPDNYSYNRNAWGNALAEVNRYKGKSGHRVTPTGGGDEHVIMQLRKAVSVGANHSGVKFKDGETHKISAKTAQKHLDHYSKLKPEDKIKWQNSAAHSHGGLSSASSEKKLGQDKPKSAFKRDEPTRKLINPMDKN